MSDPELALELRGGLQTWTERLAPHTRRSYDGGLRDFSQYLHERDLLPEPSVPLAGELLLGLQPGQANALVQAYLEHLSTKCSRRTVSARLAALRWAVREARRLGRIVWALDVDLPKVKKDPKTGRVEHRGRDMTGPPIEVVAKMFKLAEADPDPRVLLVLSLIYAETLRSHEVRALDLADIHGDAVKVTRKKRDEPELVPMSKHTDRALSRWLEVRCSEPGPLVWGQEERGPIPRPLAPGTRISETGITRIIRRLGFRCDVVTSPHRVRHTSIRSGEALLTELGVPRPDAMARSGHRSMAGYEAYLDPDLDNIRRITETVMKGIGR